MMVRTPAAVLRLQRIVLISPRGIKGMREQNSHASSGRERLTGMGGWPKLAWRSVVAIAIDAPAEHGEVAQLVERSPEKA